jgi:acyl-CoA oxidase
LPGVTVGDCGHKNGCNNVDNGYIILDHVRIPKKNALDGISGVDNDGKFWAVV